MEGKCKRIETPLPEAMIHHIQSFLTAKEAARTTLLSKSWHSAWLTRPALAFDQCSFKTLHRRSSLARISKYVTKTMQRYQGLNLKIESLSLQMQSCRRSSIEPLAHKLISDAMKLGITALNLEFRPSTLLPLPREVLQSQALLMLSIKWCKIEGDFSCRRLRSLSLDSVVSCCNSIEELSFSNSCNSRSTFLVLRGRNNLWGLDKLNRLYLELVRVEGSFLEGFGSRFPCLTDLSLVRCHGYGGLNLSSTSFRRISIVQLFKIRGEFDVPNLACFSYSGFGLPSLSVEAREWKSCISLTSNNARRSSWFASLQKLLIELSRSRINLCLCIGHGARIAEGDVHVVGEPVAVENLTFVAEYDWGCALLVGLFSICRPKFVTHRWLPESCGSRANRSLKKLMQEVLGPNCRVPDRSLFSRFGLEQVSVEMYEEIVEEWRPLGLNEPGDAVVAPPPTERKIRFRLKW